MTQPTATVSDGTPRKLRAVSSQRVATARQSFSLAQSRSTTLRLVDII